MIIFQFFYNICELLRISSYMFLMNKIILYKDNLNMILFSNGIHLSGREIKYIYRLLINYWRLIHFISRPESNYYLKHINIWLYHKNN